MEIIVEVQETFPIDEFKKSIGFISRDITGFEIMEKEHELSVRFAGESETKESLKNKIETSMKRFFSGEGTNMEEVVAEFSENKNDTNTNTNSIYIKTCGEGLIGLSGYGVKLYQYFDSVFRNFAMEQGAKEEQYPVLLPLHTYRNTGYLRNSPQYSMFCCDVVEDLEELASLRNLGDSPEEQVLQPVQYALSPSACFHVYEAYRGKVLQENQTVTLCQSVFRNEGRFNWSDFGRLRDYHVRELVFIGTPEYVEGSRKCLMDKTIAYMERLGLQGRMVSSADCFVIPQMQKFKRIQFLEKRKYEWQLTVGDNQRLAVASFNLHDENFTRPFQIQVRDRHTVTGCVGFGLERMVLAFLSQFGDEAENWPEIVRNSVCE